MQPLDQTARFELKGQWWRSEGAELIRKFGDTPKPSAGFDEGFARLQSERDQLEGTDLDHACRGPLTFDPESGLRLSLLGSSEIAFPEHETEFAVHGLTSTGVPCSLLDCFVTNSQKHFPSGSPTGKSSGTLSSAGLIRPRCTTLRLIVSSYAWRGCWNFFGRRSTPRTARPGAGSVIRVQSSTPRYCRVPPYVRCGGKTFSYRSRYQSRSDGACSNCVACANAAR